MSEKEPAILQKNEYLKLEDLDKLFKALQAKAAWAEKAKEALEDIEHCAYSNEMTASYAEDKAHKCLAEYPKDDK